MNPIILPVMMIIGLTAALYHDSYPKSSLPVFAGMFSVAIGTALLGSHAGIPSAFVPLGLASYFSGGWMICPMGKKILLPKSSS